jgi:hypothetical protein
MPRLTNWNQEPFGGWKYVQRETLATFTSDNGDSLVEKVRLHRAYKGLKPDDYAGVRSDVEAQLCLGLDERYCRAEMGEKWQPLSIFFNISVEQVMDFTSAMFTWLKEGGSFADKKVAVERAAICRACPLNHRAHACACGPLYAMVDSLVPADRREPGLHICHACGCSLTLKAVMPPEIINYQQTTNPKRYPDYCWQGKE